MSRRSRLAILTVAAFAFAVPVCAQGSSSGPPGINGTSEAADSALDARTSAVASKLRCPVCQGLSIQESPSELAQQMRSVVRDQLAAGRSAEQVQSYFVSKYGQWILLSPDPTGINLIAYGLPIVVVVGGLAVIALAVRRWTSVPASPAAPAERATE